MPDVSTLAVLGFRPHTYWTSVVALAGPLEAPQVVVRKKLFFASGDEKFVYHQAENMPPAAAEANVERVRTATTGHVVTELGALIADLENDGFAVASAVAPSGAAKVPATTAQIVKSHSAMHAAEGHFYRDVVAGGCAALGLKTHRLAEKTLRTAVAKKLGVDPAALDDELKAMGVKLGAPWSEDFKLATLAAWTQL